MAANFFPGLGLKSNIKFASFQGC